MAQYTGGDIIGVSCNHPTLGSFSFAAKTNESYTMDPGGFRSNDDEAGITGGGVFIDQINRVRWSFEGVLVMDLVSGDEIVNLPKLSGSPELGVWTFEHISGAIYKGTGKPVGSLSIDTNTVQVTVKIAGGGQLEKL